MGYAILVLWLAVWVGFAIYGFKKKWSGIVSIGGGFFTACVVVAVIGTIFVENKSSTAKQTTSHPTSSKPSVSPANGDRKTQSIDNANTTAKTDIAYKKGYLMENGLICDRPEKVGEFLYRLEKYNSFNTPGCLMNTSNQQIPVFIIDSGHVNGEDVTEAKVSMDKASIWTLTSNLR